MTRLTPMLLLTVPMCLWAHSSAAITAGQVDDFQDGTTQGWISGSSNPNPPTNLADSGPAGLGDHVLQVTASGVSGAGGKLVFFNEAQWLGDYNAAGVTAIRFDAKNAGSNNVSLGFDINDGSALTLDTGTITPGSGWDTYEIPLTSFITGSTSTLDNVSQIRMRHMSGGSFISGTATQVQIDNITAVPEPSALAVMGVGLCVMLRRPRRAEWR